MLIWKSKREQVMADIFTEKFNQNSDLAAQMKATGKKVLAKWELTVSTLK